MFGQRVFRADLVESPACDHPGGGDILQSPGVEWFVTYLTGRRPAVALLLVAMVPTGIPAIERKCLGEIEFFGYKSIDVVAIRSVLPFHEGDAFPPAKVKHSDDLKVQVREGKTSQRPRAHGYFVRLLRLEAKLDGLHRVAG
jgi:hypothetical protein